MTHSVFVLYGDEWVCKFDGNMPRAKAKDIADVLVERYSDVRVFCGKGVGRMVYEVTRSTPNIGFK